jgi:hypothetical protein
MPLELDNMTSESPTPAEALASVRRSREAMAERVKRPAWFDLVTAACAGGMVASQALPPGWPTAVAAVGTVILWLSCRVLARRTGVTVTSVPRGRGRWVVLGLMAVLLILVFGSFCLQYPGGVWWAPLPAGVLAALAVHTASRLWMRAYRAELRNDA